MDTTTIQITLDVRDKIDSRKVDGESYNDALRRILSDSGVLHTEEEIEEIARRVVDEELRNLEGRV